MNYRDYCSYGRNIAMMDVNRNMPSVSRKLQFVNREAVNPGKILN